MRQMEFTTETDCFSDRDHPKKMCPFIVGIQTTNLKLVMQSPQHLDFHTCAMRGIILTKENNQYHTYSQISEHYYFQLADKKIKCSKNLVNR